MKFFLILLAQVLIVNFSYTQIVIEKSEIKEVKVFFQGAEITRSFDVSLQQGKNELRITDISSSIDPGSIVITANPDVRIISVYYESDFKNKITKDNALKKTRDSIEMIESKIEFKDYQIEALEAEKKSLIQNSVRVGSTQGITVNELDQTLAYMRKKQDEINTMLLQREEEVRMLDRILENLQQRESRLLSFDSSSISTVNVLVESFGVQKAKFNLNYYVKSCGWAPAYNVYYKGVEAPLVLDYKANILNNSGENWEKVNITLLAGNPARSLTLPNLETWVLSYHRRKRNGKVYADNDYGNEGSLSKKQLKNGQSDNNANVELQEIEVEEGEMNFKIKGTHSIPSSEREYLVDVTHFDLDASYLYQAIPKLDSKAYLIAKVNDWEQLKLIEGNANIFLNQTFVGKTYIDPLNTGDTLDISLGPDPSIQISRVKKKDFSTRKLIGLQLVESFAYEIDIRNLNSKPITIEVFDQIPIAQQEEIQISLEEKDGASYQEGNGKLTWKLEIPSSKTVKVKLGYKVKYPKDKVVIIKRTGRVVCPKFRM